MNALLAFLYSQEYHNHKKTNIRVKLNFENKTNKRDQQLL